MSLSVKKRPAKQIYESGASFTNNKYLLDGLSDSFEFSGATTSSQNITISFWVKQTDSTDRHLFLWSNGISGENISLWDNSGDLFFSDANNSGIVGPPIPINELTNITLKINNGSVKAYINGISTASPALSVDALNLSGSGVVLKIGEGFTQTLEGQWDQFIIYDIALTDQEIFLLYNNGKPLNTDVVRTRQNVIFFALNREGIELYNSDATIAINGSPELIEQSNIKFFEDPIFLSTWNAIGGDLPVRYDIKSNLFPSNEIDVNLNVLSVSEFFGNSLFNTSASHGYNQGDYVTQSGFSINAYNGLFRVVSTPSATSYSVQVLFDVTDTGSSLKYYNNYQAIVKVYSGIPEDHPLNQYKPIQEITELSITPNTNNIAEVDITTLIKDQINNINGLYSGLMPSDLNDFTAFYIEYAESYDIATANGIQVFQSSFTRDSFDNCSVGTELFNDPEFNLGLTNWFQTGPVANTLWSTGTGSVSCTYVNRFASRILYQDNVFLKKGTTYQLKLNKTGGSNVLIKLLVTDTNAPASQTIWNPIFETKNEEILFFFTADENYNSVGLVANFNISQTDGSIVTIDEYSIEEADCTPVLWGSNSVNQFQYYLGGNMGEYVSNNNQVLFSKFMTNFEDVTYFKGFPLTLSTIIPQQAFNQSYLSSSLFYRSNITLNDNTSIEFDSPVKNLGNGVYRIGYQNNTDLFDTLINSVENTTGKKVAQIDVQLASVPNNDFVDGNQGGFNNTSFASNPPSDWDMTILAPVTNKVQITNLNLISTPEEIYEGSGVAIILIQSNGISEAGPVDCFTFDTPVDLKENSDYTISYYVRNAKTFGAMPPELLNNFKLLIYPDGYTEEELILNVETVPSADSAFLKCTVGFNTGTNGPFTFNGSIDLINEINFFGVGFFILDFAELLGPFEPLSEVKTIKVDQKCYNQGIYLQWKTKNGGFDSWLFTTEKDYTNKLGKSTLVKRDIFNNWDTNFIEGQAQYDFTDIQSRKEILVRSQFLTESEFDAIAQIKESISVQQVQDDGKLITVEVDKANFPTKQDRQNLYEIEFTIKYPDNLLQNQ